MDHPVQLKSKIITTAPTATLKFKRTPAAKQSKFLSHPPLSSGAETSATATCLVSATAPATIATVTICVAASTRAASTTSSGRCRREIMVLTQ